MRKICRECYKNKKISKFGLNRSQPDDIHYICKKCNRLKRQAYFKTKRGVLTDMYSNQVKSSKERGINPPDYTKAEFSRFVLEAGVFHTIFDEWVLSSYCKWNKPSCDRIDPNKGYILDNLEVVTWLDNLNKVTYEIGVPVYVYDENYVLIYSYDTILQCLSEHDYLIHHHRLKELNENGELFKGYYFSIGKRLKND